MRWHDGLGGSQVGASPISGRQHDLARLYHGVSWMYFVSHPKHLRVESFDVPVECVAEGDKLRVLLLMPPLETGCPVQFSLKVLGTLVRLPVVPRMCPLVVQYKA